MDFKSKDTLEEIIESHYKPQIKQEKASGIEYEFYIDCFDLIDIIKGVKRFTEGNSPFKGLELKSITYNLILDGWIKNVRLLPTHQTEFLDLLNCDFGIVNPLIGNEDINTIIKRISKSKPGINITKDTDEKECRKFIEDSVDESINRFNLFGLISYNNWAYRLNRLLNPEFNILEIKNYSLSSYMEYMNEDIFKKIKNEIDIQRPDSIKNRSNFNDAMALTYLYKLRLKDAKKIPILLDSTGFYQRIIDSCNLHNEFVYNLNIDGKDNRYSIVRDNTYFILKSIFDCPENKLKQIENKFPKYYEILESKEEAKITSIDTLLEENNVETNFYIEGLGLRKLYDDNKKDFINYLENEFFNKIYLSCYENDAFNVFIRNYFKYLKQETLNIENVISQYKVSFNETYNSVKKASDIFSKLTKVWVDLNNVVTDGIITTSNGHPFQSFLLCGIFRFSFPFNNPKKENLDKINEELSEILFEDGFLGGTELKKIAISKTIKKIYDGISDVEKNKPNLSYGIAILWSLERYKSINLLLEDYFKNGEYPDYSFGIVHCASILKVTQMSQSVKNKINKIIRCIETKIIVKDNYKYLIGKSYIHILMWRSEFINNFSDTLCSPTIKSKYFNESIKTIEKAIEIIKQKEYKSEQLKSMLIIYSLNLKVYLLAEGGTDKDIINLEREFKLFIQHEAPYKSLWDGRYDDTISRYYLRLALIKFSEKNTVSFEHYLQRAEDRIVKSINNSSQGRDFKSSFRDQVFSIKEKYMDEEKNQSLTNFLNQCNIK